MLQDQGIKHREKIKSWRYIKALTGIGLGQKSFHTSEAEIAASKSSEVENIPLKKNYGNYEWVFSSL